LVQHVLVEGKVLTGSRKEKFSIQIKSWKVGVQRVLSEGEVSSSSLEEASSSGHDTRRARSWVSTVLSDS